MEMVQDRDIHSYNGRLIMYGAIANDLE